MVTKNTQLPEGTDKVVPGAATTASDMEAELITVEKESTTKDKALATIKDGRDKVATEAAGKARGLVGDGLARSSDMIGNAAKLVGDTASSLDERLGEEYGDYARRASTYLSDTARSLAEKDPDELIDDTRDFVRRSPAIALAGAAIIGFALARLVQSGLDADKADD